MTIDEVKHTIKSYEALEKKAEEILSADNIYDDGIISIGVRPNGSEVYIYYWTRYRGEACPEKIIVPIEWFSVSREKLSELWRMKHDNDRSASLKKAKKTAAAQKKAAAARKRKRELATLKRLKEKYENDGASK